MQTVRANSNYRFPEDFGLETKKRTTRESRAGSKEKVVPTYGMRAIPHPKLSRIELTDILHALSDPARLEIVRQLATAGSKTCSELMGARPKSSMSHHFKILRASGLVHTRVEGKEHFNSLRTEELNKRFPGLLGSVLEAAGADGTAWRRRK